MEKKFLKHFFIQVCVLLALAAAVVIVIDPFFHYHSPVSPLKAVVTKAEYQCVGTIDHFDYDSILLGSSVAENFNNRWFDDCFDCKTVKGIKESGTTADLIYYLERAYESHEIENVFYSLDLFALYADTQPTVLGDGMPLYLYNDNPIDDVKYVWNKTVIFEHIPYMAAMSLIGDYDEGMSYNWGQYKTFSAADTVSRYNRLSEKAEVKSADEYVDLIDENISLIEEQIKAHPETNFYIMYPPYSMLWWDNIYMCGELEQYFYALEESARRLSQYDNVRINYYQAEESIILDLNHYMDNIHFSEAINAWMVEQWNTQEYALTSENYTEYVDKMRILVDEIEAYHIKEYYE
ncbi:MAG: SGNH/GDSL hydrolase family protein [Lachnospiraceae bacterium]|nr:SGNH/GDSL hydrolase family protein [Lachnospiraceae bacterium]